MHADDAEAVDERDEIERVRRRPWAADEVLFRSSEYGGDRDSSSDEDSSDSDSDSDDDDDIDHVMSKDEVAALKKDQGNVIPRAKRRAALASGIGDASALEAIQQAKPDSDEEAEFEF